MKLLLSLLLVCYVTSILALNEDERLDELNMLKRSRSKRALCGYSRDPVCKTCSCNTIYPIYNKNPFSKILGKRQLITRTKCTADVYKKCCVRQTLSNSQVRSMATDMLKLYGKRATDSQFKKPSIDLVFVIDDSGSIPAAQFKVAKEGAATLSQALCPNTFGSQKGGKQVSVVLFSTVPKTVMTFEESRKGAGYVEDKILDLKQRSGSTATTSAIRHVREKILAGPGNRLNDTNTATVVFVITDGRCNNNCGQLAAESKKLREAGPGVQLFAFGVGEADCDELELIRGKEAGKVFGLPSFDFFEKFAIAVKEHMAKNPGECVV